MAKVGATLGAKYSLHRELGRGGMGSVFAAENTWTGRQVAIKTLSPDFAQEPAFIERFWQEARCASLLRHPHIVDVLDLGVDEASGEPFIVQEYLDGSNLDRLLDETPGRRLSPGRALLLLLPVMQALVACHGVGIIHRDIKPSNVVLARQPGGAVVPKLIDFGISKSLAASGPRRNPTSAAAGTPEYMSPEQARGERDIDARVDVWAMGVTLFEAVTGRRPFEGANPRVVVAQILLSRAPPTLSVAPELPADLAAVIDRSLEPERAQRIPSMAAFIEDLLRCEVCRDPSFAAFSEVARRGADTLDEPTSGVSSSNSPVPPTHCDTISEDPPTMLFTRRERLNPLRLPVAALAIVALCLVFARASARSPRAASPATVAAQAPPSTSVPLPALPRVAPPDPAQAPPLRPPALAPAEVSAGAPRTPARPVTATAAAPRRPAVRARPVAVPVARPAATEVPAAAPPRDPLAPDETPYHQIRRRAGEP